MRLGQLARKLAIRPADVIAALPAGSLPPDSNSNIRLTDEQVKEVVQFFRPDNWLALVQEFLAEDANLSEAVGEKPVALQPLAEPPANEPPALLPSPPEEKPELIKAPKVELPGLKVVGKIELPEKKGKEATPRQNEEGTRPAAVQKGQGMKPPRKQFRNRQKGNPIAAARERQQRELEKQKRLEAEREKERRTKKYQAKVAGRKRVKPVNAPSKPAMPVQPETTTRPPATFWGKFKKWLFRE
jgi:hypothetical protein